MFRHYKDRPDSHPFKFPNTLLAIGLDPQASYDPMNANDVSNLFSHLSALCNGQAGNYVMNPSFYTNDFLREITTEESRIFCEMGYSVNNGMTSCNGCFVVPQSDVWYELERCCYRTYHGCPGEDIEILNSELLCNDISNDPTPLKITRMWASEFSNIVELQPNATNTGWIYHIPSSPTGDIVRINYTVKGCDCDLHNSFTRVYIDLQCPGCPAPPPDICENLLCNGDFEQFTGDVGSNKFGWPILFEGNQTVGTPDINTGNAPYFHFLFMGASDTPFGQFGNHLESVCMPLQKCIKPECDLIMDIATCKSPATMSSTITELEVWGSDVRPCSSELPPPVTPIKRACDVINNCSDNTVFNPVCINKYVVSNPVLSLVNPNFQQQQQVVWTNNSGQDICYVTLVPKGSSVFVDNLVIVPKCNVSLTMNATAPEEVCAGQIFNIRYEVCLTDLEGESSTTITPQITLPDGWTAEPIEPFDLNEEQCTTIVIQVQVPLNTSLDGYGVQLDVSAPGVCDAAIASQEFKITVIDCGNHTFSCPCTGNNQLNIDATSASVHYNSSLMGVPWSALENANNYDQNNDGVIDASDHHGCIAIAGRLIMDANVTIKNCPDIRMQPCSEIVVPAQQQVGFTQNGIYGCEQMWKGITVQPYGWLTFTNNIPVRDAEIAIHAIGSNFIWPTVGNFVTSIQVRGNRFEKNHIGVMAEGPAFTSLQHLPFRDNLFFGGIANQTLLPPCDAMLPNWNTQNGYAGVVSRNINFSVGSPIDNTYTNNFTNLRNGVIGENCHIEVQHARFLDITGQWLNEGAIPTFTSSTGIGVLSNNGNMTVGNSYFERCGHGIYSSNGILKAFRNNMPEVIRGVEFFLPVSCEIAENEEINYHNRGVVGRELQTTPFGLFKYAIHKNTLRDLTAITAQEDVIAAIDIRNGNQPELNNARMSENNCFLTEDGDGVKIANVGRWTLDRNVVQYEIPNSFISRAFKLNASAGNYLYDNSVIDLFSETDGLRSFEVNMSPRNQFCCNYSSGAKWGYNFLNSCPTTNLRTADLSSHAKCLEINATGTIGEQGILVANNQYVNHQNFFNLSSGAARHLSNSIQVISSSRFHVLSNQTPDFPEAIETPNSPGAQWFTPNGGGELTCGDCAAPPLVPDIREQETDEGDHLLAGDGFGTESAGMRMLQWEGSRDLFKRLNKYPDLLNNHSDLNGFYQREFYGSVGQYQRADDMLNSISTLDIPVAKNIAEALDNISHEQEAVNTKLGELSLALDFEDSLAVYRQAGILMMQTTPDAQWMVQNLYQAISNRSAKAYDAQGTIQSLPVMDSLQLGRKVVMNIYADIFKTGTPVISNEQKDIVSLIAQQCPESQGSAVLMARAIMRLFANVEYTDEGCAEATEDRPSDRNSWQQRTSVGEMLLLPNPAHHDLTVYFSGSARRQGGQIRLLNATGNVMLAQMVEPNSDHINLSISGLPAGIYFCIMEQNDGVLHTQKVVVQQ